MLIFVGVGSNINRVENIKLALRELGKRFGKLEISKIYESKAEGFNGKDFYNLAVGFESDIDIETLTVTLKNIESLSGRRKNAPKFSDRTLDIDILLYGDEILHTGQLDVPRAEILDYPFVLKPLSDIGGHVIHPEKQVSINKLWESFNKAGNIREIAADAVNKTI